MNQTDVSCQVCHTEYSPLQMMSFLGWLSLSIFYLRRTLCTVSRTSVSRPYFVNDFSQDT